MKMLDRKIQVFQLNDGHDLAKLMKVLGGEEDFIKKLKQMKVNSVVLNHISNGLMVCDANRTSDLGRGYVSTEDYCSKYNESELWFMALLRAYGALESKQSYNPVPEGHKFELLGFYSNYLDQGRDAR
jgi:hypothetical protein